MPGRQGWIVAILLIGLALPTPGLAGGLTNTETFGGFQFNFNSPGARALGMGGAFIGVADDATAVVTNPAGLVILQRPELSGEVKHSQFTTRIKGFSDFQWQKDFDDSVTTPSFFSFVFPTERLVASVFVRELVNFESNFDTAGVSIPGQSGGTLLPVKSHLQVTALNIGTGLGLNLSRDNTLLPDVGGSIEFSNGVVHSNLQRFDMEGHIASSASVDGSDIGIGFNIGALWRPVKEFSFGVVYRRGPRYDMSQSTQPGPISQATTGVPILGSVTQNFSLKVPDVYGAGAAFRPLDRLTISADVIRIRYSQMLDGFQFSFSDAGGAPLRRRDYKLDDAVEFHVGAEYVMFIGTIPVAARAGFYTDPDHRIRYTGLDNGERVLFPGGRDQVHGTAGFGLVPLPGVQFDFAANVSRETREFSVSTVLRF